MKKIIYLILLTFLMMACTSNEDEELIDVLKTEGVFIDSRDKHEYKWIKIGNHTWMAENLAYLPAVSPEIINNTNLPCYYVFGYNGINVNTAKATLNYTTYGVLYNWKAALTASPDGWHLPSDDEWKEMEIALGMTKDQVDYFIDYFNRGSHQGTQMKTTYGWHNNGNGTNVSGFTGLPGGYRFSNGSYWYIENLGYWWSSTEISANFAWGRGLGYNSSGVCRNSNHMENGFSVRCIKD